MATGPDPGADEFALIAAHFAPLAHHPAARGLADDAALWCGAGPLVITVDAIVEGVHFLPDDPIETVAQKALRVNLSDLAAKGALAEGVLVSLVWPSTRSASDVAVFARGLGEDLARFGCALLGGDMTSTSGPLVVSVTVFGRPLGGQAPSRSNARPGEDLWVTGVIGDAFLGLKVLQGGLEVQDDERDALVSRYRTPEPRVAWADWIGLYAGASMDVSDGLIADARKLAQASGVALAIDPEAIPLSPASRRLVSSGAVELSGLISGGDDYEILFTAAPALADAIRRAGAERGVLVSRIGAVQAGAGVRAIASNGDDLAARSGGFVHRIGR